MAKTDRDPGVYAGLRALIALQHQARGFSFLPAQPVRSLLSGRRASRLRGRGLNFEELRHYRHGDDIRNMDWKVTNRTRKPHVRVFTEERERPALLMVDQRLSMFFGSQQRMKSVVAAELTALAAWRVVSVGDRIGAFIFNDTEIVEVKPQRNRNTVLRILGQTVRLNHLLRSGGSIKPDPRQLIRALREVERVASHDYLIVIISDMDGWNAEAVKRIKRLARHNDVIGALVFDPLETELRGSSKMVVSDGSLQIEVDAGKRKLKTEFARRFTSTVDYLDQELRKHRVPSIPVDTIEPIQDQVRRAIGVKPGAHNR